MDKILTYLLILAVTKDERKTKMVMDVLYNEKPKTAVTKTKSVRKTAPVKETTPVRKPVPVVNSKQQEIMDAIGYLKSKPKKTKEDRDKIQMLEVILKSM
jgi:hypothetical protein